MAVTRKKINDTNVKNLTDGTLRDTDLKGFVCKVRRQHKLFYYEYRSPITKQDRKLPLGRYGEVTPTQAREAAKKAAGLRSNNLDPIVERDKKIVEIKRATVTLDDFLDNHLAHLVENDNAQSVAKTVRRYFKKYLGQTIEGALNYVNVMKWRNAYKGERSGANRTISDVRTAVRAALKGGFTTDRSALDVPRFKVDRNKQVKYLKRDQIKLLLEGIDDYIKHDNSTKADHLRVIVNLAIDTGLRQSEILNFKVSDIDFDRLVIRADAGSRQQNTDMKTTGTKSGHSRYIPITTHTADYLREWIKSRGCTTLVFPNRNGKRADRKLITRPWEKVLNRLDLYKKINFHGLRHTFGTIAAESNTDLVAIQEMMGHASLETTSMYLHTDIERKREVIEKMQAGMRD